MFQLVGDFASTRGNAEPVQQPAPTPGFEGVDWSRLKGLKVPLDDCKKESHIFEHGWRLWRERDDVYLWLCRICHTKKKLMNFKEALYDCTEQTTSAARHLRHEHKIVKDNTPEGAGSRKRTALQAWQQAGCDGDTAHMNEAATGFDPFHFKALLYDWIVSDNVSFRELESAKLLAVLTYLQP
ncbi:hypothetical protein B0A49_13789, partial [Cryomyces minteri]